MGTPTMKETMPLRFIPTGGAADGLTIYAVMVRNPTFADIDWLNAWGWTPNDPDNDLDLQHSTLFTTVDVEAAEALMPLSQWQRDTAVHTMEYLGEEVID
jgi:hypothetical protein